MNSDRIKEIQKETAYPDSISVQQALLKVWNECEQSHKSEVEKLNLPDVVSSLLPCGEVGCQNPHEKAYRGCDICKFKKQ